MFCGFWHSILSEVKTTRNFLADSAFIFLSSNQYKMGTEHIFFNRNWQKLSAHEKLTRRYFRTPKDVTAVLIEMLVKNLHKKPSLEILMAD